MRKFILLAVLALGACGTEAADPVSAKYATEAEADGHVLAYGGRGKLGTTIPAGPLSIGYNLADRYPVVDLGTFAPAASTSTFGLRLAFVFDADTKPVPLIVRTESDLAGSGPKESCGWGESSSLTPYSASSGLECDYLPGNHYVKVLAYYGASQSADAPQVGTTPLASIKFTFTLK